MAPTNSVMAPRSSFGRRIIRLKQIPPARHRPNRINPAASGGAPRADKSNEPLATVHFTTGRNYPADDRHHAVRPVGVQIPAGRSAARSRLSDHSGPDLLS